jgi:hypothetical protein
MLKKSINAEKELSDAACRKMPPRSQLRIFKAIDGLPHVA